MSPAAKKWLWGIGGSVITALIVAGTVWFVPYQIDHHKKSDISYVMSQQTDKAFREYMLYQEYRELMAAKRSRALTDIEMDRLDRVTIELQKIRSGLTKPH